MDPADRARRGVEAFEKFYEGKDSTWGKGSGPGSNPYYTTDYRAFLDKFVRMNSVRSVVDIGCGDWQFSRFLNFDEISYRGFDVVKSVVERNARCYGAENITFSLMPDDVAAIPAADLLVMKDVLQHLPDEDINRFRRLVFDKFKFVLLTNSYAKHGASRNTNVAHGGFRCLDLAAPPYSFPGAYVLEFSSAVWERIRTFLYQKS